MIQKEDTAEKEEAKPKKIKEVYTLRDIVKQHHRDLVDEEIPYSPKDKLYLGSYQRAVTTVIDNMTDAQLEEAQEMVDKWNKFGPPVNVQRK